MPARIIALYLALLAFHVAHVFEEVWGRFWLMQAVYGLGWYLVANWVLFCIPLAIGYFLLTTRRGWAYILSMGYAGIMVLNGIGHNVATLVTGRYFDGFAGGFTGIALIACGMPLLYQLWKSPGRREAR
jgi:phosphoglycerol transferase MdoB-like AlkP superfamily enzyme